MQSEAAALVHALEALRVLHSHEEFLSQVLKGFVSGKIQAVETGGEKNGIASYKNSTFGFKMQH